MREGRRLPHIIYSIALTSISFHLLSQRDTAETQRAQLSAQISVLESIVRQMRTPESISDAELDRLRKLARANREREDVSHVLLFIITMPKLRFKRTPAEEAEHQTRRAARRAKRPRTHSLDDDGDDARRANLDSYDAVEERFKEKLFGAYEYYKQLFALDDRLNDYAHVPHRWRSADNNHRKEPAAANDNDDDDDDMLDPQYMTDDQYTEWIRLGMWRRRHAAEYEEQRREQARMEALRAREEAIKRETARLAQRAKEERRRKKRETEHRRWADAREEYDTRWKMLGQDVTSHLGFDDIPWPILSAQTARKGPGHALAVEDFTEAAISAFLLPVVPRQGPDTREEVDEVARKERKERLREAILRFHPDKFDGRLLKRVRVTDREKVNEGVGQVVRVLNALMVENDAR